MKIEYLSDVQELITKNLASSNEKLASHAQTLIVPRTHGSTTKRSIMDGFGWSSMYTLCDQSNVMPGCVAYGFKDDDAIDGKVGAMPLWFVQSNWPTAVIAERDGTHGRELFATLQSTGAPLRSQGYRDNEYTVIIGEFEGETAVFTWHPGPPLVPGVDWSNPNTAVKLN